MEEEKKVSTMPFGKRVRCGNYYVLKTSRPLTRTEIKSLKGNKRIPNEVQAYLQKKVLPCITVGTIADSWKVSFMAGMTMFNALDEIPVFHDSKGNYEYIGEARVSLANLINFWASATTTVGDAEFQADCINAMQRYLDRMSEKNKAPLPKEGAEKVYEEELERAEKEGE